MYKFFPKFSNCFIFSTIILILFSCNDPRELQPDQTDSGVGKDGRISDTITSQKAVTDTAVRKQFSYTFVKRKTWFSENDSVLTDDKEQILADLNRVDLSHLSRLDSILIPSDFSAERFAYSPFPQIVPELKDVRKIIFFSYPTQYFAAYEYGKLAITGPTNMGRKNKKTPTGLFFTNWKAKESISTVDDEWILKWNYNISNFGGVGFHQYALPGYPASHSCLRLQNDDAEFLYYWAQQWTLKNDEVIAKGTPVIIFGSYPFGSPRPWFKLASDSQALDISILNLGEIYKPFMQEILKEQQNTQQVSPQSSLNDSSSVTL